MKALFINGSPRKNKNTAQMLESAMRGAQEAGAETELINLYDLDYKGCKSCFACQLKNAKTDGVCAIKDDLRPVLEKAHEADVLVIGSPVYFSLGVKEEKTRNSALAQVGLDHSSYLFGKDILDTTRTPFAFYSFSDGFALLTEQDTVVIDAKANRPVIGQEGETEQRARAFEQRIMEEIEQL